MRFGSSWISQICTFVNLLEIPEDITFTNLTTLELHSSFSPWMIRWIENCPVLSSLELYRPERQTLLQLSEIQGLRLASVQLLSLENLEPAMCGAVCAFLQRQKDTLKDLRIYTHHSPDIRVVETQLATLNLSSLKRLQLDWSGNAQLFQKPQVRFPALKELRLNVISEFHTHFKGQPVCTLQKLVIENFCHFITEDARQSFLDNAPKFFPNLKILTLEMLESWVLGNDRILNFVQQFKKLEELYFFFSDGPISRHYDLNPLLTGFSEEILRAVEQCAQALAIMKNEYRKNLSYAALSRLKILRFGCLSWTFYVSDATCRLVFLQLPKLELLHFLYRPNSDQISEDVMKEMEDKFVVISDEECW